MISIKISFEGQIKKSNLYNEKLWEMSAQKNATIVRHEEKKLWIYSADINI